MKHSAKPLPAVPFFQQRYRAKTPHDEAMRCMERGWTFNGKRYANRADWESDVCRYHGAFVLPK